MLHCTRAQRATSVVTVRSSIIVRRFSGTLVDDDVLGVFAVQVRKGERVDTKQSCNELCVCEACKELLPATSYDAEVLKNAKYHNRKLVCQACCNSGFSPKDTAA